ncbi:MAG: hypothetical protein HRT69_16820, partial [Flavobacteriaceae bacterium]|nr:hypothetical protein [Flavobacteriaceae bacterium]
MQELIKKLIGLNISIDLIEDRLDIKSPNGFIKPDILNEINLHKDKLMEFIITNDKSSSKRIFTSIPLIYNQSDYALWQREYLTESVLEGQLNYWKDKLSGYQTLNFPTDYVRSSTIDYKGAYEGFKLTKNLSDKLRYLSKSRGVTMNSVLLSSVNILL